MIYLAVALALVTASSAYYIIQTTYRYTDIAGKVAYLLAFNTIILVPASMWGVQYGVLVWAALVVAGYIRTAS